MGLAFLGGSNGDLRWVPEAVVGDVRSGRLVGLETGGRRAALQGWGSQVVLTRPGAGRSMTLAHRCAVAIAPTLFQLAAPMDWRLRITFDPEKRSGKPCVRGLRITVGDVLGWLAAGMSAEAILADNPELESADIAACLSFAADRETGTLRVAA